MWFLCVVLGLPTFRSALAGEFTALGCRSAGRGATPVTTQASANKKEQWDARSARLTAGKSVAVLPCYAGKESSAVSPPMSAATAR